MPAGAVLRQGRATACPRPAHAVPGPAVPGPAPPVDAVGCASRKSPRMMPAFHCNAGICFAHRKAKICRGNAGGCRHYSPPSTLLGTRGRGAAVERPYQRQEHVAQGGRGRGGCASKGDGGGREAGPGEERSISRQRRRLRESAKSNNPSSFRSDSIIKNSQYCHDSEWERHAAEALSALPPCTAVFLCVSIKRVGKPTNWHRGALPHALCSSEFG